MDLTQLTKIAFFRSIPQPQIEEILAQVNYSKAEFKRGEILAMQDEPCNRLIILLSGSVKGEMHDPSGKVMKVEDIEAPNPLAILFLFGAHPRFPVQVTAKQDSTALIIPKQSVLNMLQIDKILLKNYLDISADFASRLSNKLHLISFRTIRQKMAIHLLDLSKLAQSDTVQLDRTKSSLAEYFGIARQSLERELTNMQRDGLIVANKREITILERENLTSIVRF